MQKMQLTRCTIKISMVVLLRSTLPSPAPHSRVAMVVVVTAMIVAVTAMVAAVAVAVVVVEAQMICVEITAVVSVTVVVAAAMRMNAALAVMTDDPVPALPHDATARVRAPLPVVVRVLLEVAIKAVLIVATGVASCINCIRLECIIFASR